MNKNSKSKFNLAQIKFDFAQILIAIFDRNVFVYEIFLDTEEIKSLNEIQNTFNFENEKSEKNTLNFKNKDEKSEKKSSKMKSTTKSKDRENWKLFRNYDLFRKQFFSFRTILDDYFVLMIMQHFKKNMRFFLWSANFLLKNFIDYKLLETERAAKIWNEERQRWEYAIVKSIEFHEKKSVAKYRKMINTRNVSEKITSKKTTDVSSDKLDSENRKLTKAKIQISVQYWNQQKNKKTVKAVAAVASSSTLELNIIVETKKRSKTSKRTAKKRTKSVSRSKANENERTLSTEIQMKNERRRRIAKKMQIDRNKKKTNQKI